MKKFLFFILCLLVTLFVQPLNAQLRVDSVGDVKIVQHLGIGTESENNSSVRILKGLLTEGSYFGLKSTLNAAYGTTFDRQYVSICGIVETDTVNNYAPSPTSLDDPKVIRGKFKVGLL